MEVLRVPPRLLGPRLALAASLGLLEYTQGEELEIRDELVEFPGIVEPCLVAGYTSTEIIFNR